MAESPAHKLGQIIGGELEAVIHEPLVAIAGEFHLYLDHQHPRAARNGKKKVEWTDRYGNTHDLDYVLEEGGTEDVIGRPRAFIETAWRRYTKHSRNKAQEIQSAIAPLTETYQKDCPFLGVVLGGIFTDGALEQLRSHGFSIAYCPYESVLRAFASQGLDVSSEEGSSDAELERKVNDYSQLPSEQRGRIAEEIRRLHADQFDPFINSLRASLDRFVQHIVVLTLSGTSHEFDRIDDAIRFIADHAEATPASDFVRYEITVRYSNRDEIRACFARREDAVLFLRSFRN